jgi:dihydroflavonol-4-reductase
MILVTGGTGFIGSHVLDRLSAAGGPVKALIRRRADLPSGVQSALGDLAENRGLQEALKGVTTVIHIAGVIKALQSGDYYRGNVRATENLARLAAGRGIRFVHVSSLAACGPCAGDTPIHEDVKPAPITHYGKSKLEAELALRALIRDSVIVRPPVVYGPRDRGVFGLLKSISRGVDARIGGGERWFSLVYIDDLVDGLLAAARAPHAAGRTYFISHPKPENWTSLGEISARIIGRKPVVLRVPVPAAYAVGWLGEVTARVTRKPGFVSREKIAEAAQRRWVCDPRRAAVELGVNASTSLEAGLACTLAWYKEAGWLKY